MIRIVVVTRGEGREGQGEGYAAAEEGHGGEREGRGAIIHGPRARCQLATVAP